MVNFHCVLEDMSTAEMSELYVADPLIPPPNKLVLVQICDDSEPALAITAYVSMLLFAVVHAFVCTAVEPMRNLYVFEPAVIVENVRISTLAYPFFPIGLISFWQHVISVTDCVNLDRFDTGNATGETGLNG